MPCNHNICDELVNTNESEFDKQRINSHCKGDKKQG